MWAGYGVNYRGSESFTADSYCGGNDCDIAVNGEILLNGYILAEVERPGLKFYLAQAITFPAPYFLFARGLIS